MTSTDLLARSRDILLRLCSELGVPGPRPEVGLMAWTDEATGALLVGSPAWQEAHGHILDALECALMGHEEATRQALILARDEILHHAALACSCRAPLVSSHSAGWCFSCGNKRP